MVFVRLENILIESVERFEKFSLQKITKTLIVFGRFRKFYFFDFDFKKNYEILGFKNFHSAARHAQQWKKLYPTHQNVMPHCYFEQSTASARVCRRAMRLRYQQTANGVTRIIANRLPELPGQGAKK